MVLLDRGRFFLSCALAVALAVLTVSVVSAGESMRDSLAGALRVDDKTCDGSGPGAQKLSRVCNHAAVTRPRKSGKRGGKSGQGKSPVAAIPPAAAQTPSSHGPIAMSNPAPAPSPAPAGTPPAPETPPANPTPPPAEPPNPAPQPPPTTDPDPPAPQPEPEPTPPPPPPKPNPSPSPVPSGTPPPAHGPGSIYWGAWIGNHLTGTEAPWDMGAVTKLEQMAGKNLSIVNFSAPFANCSGGSCSFYNFPQNEFNSIRAHGSIPFYSWGSQSIPAPYGVSQPNFELSDVIAGTYDSFIRQFATAAKDWGKPFFLRFNWEMNGGWFNWSEGTNGNQKGEYVAAWRHVHDIFTEVGATNATWVWCPNVDPDNIFQDLAGLYPGDAYVDWTGLDGYNWGTNPARPDKWRSFDSLYNSTYREIAEQIAPTKPMIISEVGSTEFGGSKATWIRDMLNTVATGYAKIRGLLYFEKYDDGMDWPLGTTSTATTAFATGIKHSAYAANAFGSLNFGRVQPAG